MSGLEGWVDLAKGVGHGLQFLREADAVANAHLPWYWNALRRGAEAVNPLNGVIRGGMGIQDLIYGKVDAGLTPGTLAAHFVDAGLAAARRGMYGD